MTGERIPDVFISCSTCDEERIAAWRRELAELAGLTAEEIVARHDFSLAVPRLRAWLSESDQGDGQRRMPEAETAAWRYAEIFETRGDSAWLAEGQGDSLQRALVPADGPRTAGVDPGEFFQNSREALLENENYIFIYVIGAHNRFSKTDIVHALVGTNIRSDERSSYNISYAGTVLGSRRPLNQLRLFEQHRIMGPTIVEMSGVIRYFNISKGYGVIVPDNNLPEVYLHAKCLRDAGYAMASEGSRVHCLVLCYSTRLQVFQVLGVDQSAALHPAQHPHSKKEPRPQGKWERAVVKVFNRIRGFGFLSRGKRSPDIRISKRTLQKCGFAELRPGQEVDVRWGQGSQGVTAVEIRPVGTLDNAPSSH